ncbi:3-oxoadipate enol-lactonase [Streptomyces sp. V3I8]|uniref:alpha/beta fold hydrolase n=1 Tax=Streptomyces sp. V3I8 TaxID=3042279 RepID=UPI002782EA7A|nr:alpha/beta hydrolase [Streptomyces sp. V3I8]MDQ1041571.1 3-oxoadipate enol-lactonase [Streptomyces sp. V3I8]
MGFLAYNGGSIHYESVGSGTPVVLIHGFTFDHRMWRHQVRSLREDFRVVTYDCRGFGRSSTPVGPYSHHDDLRHLLRHLGIARPHVVGLSMGGRIALNHALARPDAPRSLVLIGTDVGGFPFGFDWDAGLAGVSTAAAKAMWLRHGLFDPVRARPEAWRLVQAMVDGYSGWHWRNGDMRVPADTGALARLAEIRTPVDVAVGALDLADFHEIAGVLAARIPHARHTVLPGVGHLAPLEDPPAVNALLRRAFTSCS